MKKQLTVACLCLLAVVGCHRDKDDVIKRIEERPKDLTNVTLCDALYANIMSLFKEGHNSMQKYPLLFSQDYKQRIVLTKDAEIFVTFIGEGAGKSNSLGWYTYVESEAPEINSGFHEQIVFPHVSNSTLQPGDTRKLSIGKFKAGTVVSFFLVVSGWSKGNIDFEKSILYSDPELNDQGARQAIMFQEKNCNDVVVGFEDLELSASDLDFNDILFKVSDNDKQQISSSFDMEIIPIF